MLALKLVIIRGSLQSLPGALDSGQYVGAGLAPDVALGAQVVLLQVAVDGLGQLAHAGEAAVAHDVHREVAEEPLDEVHPGAGVGGEVHGDAVDAVRPAVAAVVPLRPGPHLGVLVGGVVVHDQVQAHPVGYLPVQAAQEVEPLPVGVPGGGLADDFAVQVGQRRKQGDGAVAPVVVGLGGAVAAQGGEAGLGALQGLALALLVAAQHQPPLRRVQVQPHHVPELLLEARGVRQLRGGPGRVEVPLPGSGL